MKIPVSLNVKSINKAIEQLKKAKEQLQGDMMNDLLIGCYRWFIDKANGYLELTQIGENVKSGIMSSWSYIINEKTMTITNTHDKAVFVEFGVGIVGEQSKHKNAQEAGYKYNVSSSAKDENGTWHFWTNAPDLDIPQSQLISSSHIYRPETRKDGSVYRQRIYAETQGAESVMYAYNALVDLREYGAKEIWEKIKLKYWR